MKLTVQVPGPLLPYSAGQGTVEVETEGRLVQDALQALWRLHPRLRDRILDEQGRVRPHVHVFLDSESIRYTGGLQTPLAEGATLSVLAAVSGGAPHWALSST